MTGVISFFYTIYMPGTKRWYFKIFSAIHPKLRENNCMISALLLKNCHKKQANGKSI
jgi:hypothetical protein